MLRYFYEPYTAANLDEHEPVSWKQDGYLIFDRKEGCSAYQAIALCLTTFEAEKIIKALNAGEQNVKRT